MADLRQAAKTAPGLFTLPVRAWVCPKCGASSPPEIGVNQDTAMLLLEATKALLHHFCGSGPRDHTDAEVMGMAEAALSKAAAGSGGG